MKILHADHVFLYYVVQDGARRAYISFGSLYGTILEAVWEDGARMGFVDRFRAKRLIAAARRVAYVERVRRQIEALVGHHA